MRTRSASWGNRLIAVGMSAWASACVVFGPGPPPDHGTSEPPVAEWRDFEAADRGSLAEVLSGLRPAVPEEEPWTMEWTGALAATIPEAGTWGFSLGLAPARAVRAAGYRPFLLWPGAHEELVVTRSCLNANGCVSCMDAVAGEGPPAVPRREFTGICATLSTAYSLVYSLGLRSEFDTSDGPPGTMVERGGRKYWRKGYLDGIRQDQGHAPDSGTRIDQIPRAYERYGCRCDPPLRVSEAGGGAAWKEALRRKLEGDEPVDCHFIIHMANGPGHDMHIDGMNDRGELLVSDTGKQGSGSGDDAPVVAGHQVWRVHDSGGIDCRDAPNRSDVVYWLRKRITDASMLCCSCPDA